MATQQQRTATLSLRRTFQASRERVFRAWTTPEEIKRWKGPGDQTTSVVEVDLRVGGAYRVHMRAPDGNEVRLVGVYREVDPPKKLVYTWAWETSPEMGETLVTVEFLERGRATEVVLKHELFPADEARDLHAHGWHGSLDKLAGILSRQLKAGQFTTRSKARCAKETGMMTEKEQYLNAAAREFSTTVKVLRAYPATKGGFKPHAKSRTAHDLAWNFVIEERACDMALDGAIELARLPTTPATLTEVISSYETSHAAFIERVKKTPDADLNKTVKFTTGPKKVEDLRTMDVFWMMLMDAVHHRGQFSVYLRMADGKVPSIYGPTADEPWS